MKAILLFLVAVAMLVVTVGWIVARIHGTRVRFFYDGKILTNIGDTWPRWKFFRIAVVTLQVDKPSTGRRVLFYTRRYLRYVDFVLDRRENLNFENSGA